MNERPDIEALRARLDGTRGREYWRSLEALSGTPEFKEFLHREFPQNASEWLDPVGPPRLPEADERVAGAGRRQRLHPPARPRNWCRTCASRRSSFRASRCSTRRRCRMRRSAWASSSKATKAGRPRSKATRIIRPAAARPTCSRRRRFSASTIPIGRRRITHLGEIRPFTAFVAAGAGDAGRAARRRRAPGFRILTETVASPTLGRADQRICCRLPAAKWVQWEPFGRRQRARGQPPGVRRIRRRRSTRSRRPTSSSRSTPTSCAPARSACATRARLRRAAASRATRRKQNRLYAVESTPTNTGPRRITACR